MWYFAWILGVLLACSFGIINAMWLESRYDMNVKRHLVKENRKAKEEEPSS